MSELVVAGVGGSRLLRQLSDALVVVADGSVREVTDLRERASVVEAAAVAGKAVEVELAAARLRLFAERRLGDWLLQGFRVDELSGSEEADFRRLATIPRRFKRRYELLGERRVDVVDLWERAVDEQLVPRKSHTAYSVWRCSLSISAMQHPQFSYVYSTWEPSSWEIWYTDPRTKRMRKKHVSGSLEQALEERAVLSGRVSASTTKLLPVRGKDPLAAVIDHTRQAREAVAEQWPKLNAEQRKALDGVYGHLDDVVRAVVVAVNL